MKPGICNRHDAQRFVLTSPRLASAVTGGEDMEGLNARTLRIEGATGSFEYLVDSEFLEGLGISSKQSPVLLKDRNRVSRQLNDRLAILRLMRDMRWVCPACLHAAVR